MDVLKQIINAQKQWAHSLNKNCQDGYLDCYLENLFIPLEDDDLQSFKKGSGKELEDRDGEKAKMRALNSSSALCVNFFLYLKKNDLLNSFLKLIGIKTDICSISGEFEKQLNTGASSAKANLDFYIKYNTSIVGIESKFTEHYSEHHYPLKQSYLSKKQDWLLKEKYSFAFPNLSKWIKDKWKIDDYVYEGKKYVGRYSPFIYLDVEQLVKHLFALNNENKHYTLVYIHYDLPCHKIDAHNKEIDTFEGILKNDGVSFISISYQEIFKKLSKDLSTHYNYLDYMQSRYSLDK